MHVTPESIAQAYLISIAQEPLKKKDPRVHGLHLLLIRYKVSHKQFFESLEAVSGGDEKIIITSKRALSAHEKDEIASHVHAKGAIVEEVIDEEILGGVRVKKGDYVYDYTVNAKLKSLKKHLKAS